MNYEEDFEEEADDGVARGLRAQGSQEPTSAEAPPEVTGCVRRPGEMRARDSEESASASSSGSSKANIYICGMCILKDIARNYCVECNNFLCNSCTIAHQHMLQFLNHTLEKLPNVDTPSIRAQRPWVNSAEQIKKFLAKSDSLYSRPAKVYYVLAVKDNIFILIYVGISCDDNRPLVHIANYRQFMKSGKTSKNANILLMRAMSHYESVGYGFKVLDTEYTTRETCDHIEGVITQGYPHKDKLMNIRQEAVHTDMTVSEKMAAANAILKGVWQRFARAIHELPILTLGSINGDHRWRMRYRTKAVNLGMAECFQTANLFDEDQEEFVIPCLLCRFKAISPWSWSHHLYFRHNTTAGKEGLYLQCTKCKHISRSKHFRCTCINMKYVLLNSERIPIEIWEPDELVEKRAQDSQESASANSTSLVYPQDENDSICDSDEFENMDEDSVESSKVLPFQKGNANTYTNYNSRIPTKKKYVTYEISTSTGIPCHLCPYFSHSLSNWLHHLYYYHNTSGTKENLFLQCTRCTKMFRWVHGQCRCPRGSKLILVDSSGSPVEPTHMDMQSTSGSTKRQFKPSNIARFAKLHCHLCDNVASSITSWRTHMTCDHNTNPFQEGLTLQCKECLKKFRHNRHRCKCPKDAELILVKLPSKFKLPSKVNSPNPITVSHSDVVTEQRAQDSQESVPAALSPMHSMSADDEGAHNIDEREEEEILNYDNADYSDMMDCNVAPLEIEDEAHSENEQEETPRMILPYWRQSSLDKQYNFNNNLSSKRVGIKAGLDDIGEEDDIAGKMGNMSMDEDEE